MSLSERVSSLATRVGEEFASIKSLLDVSPSDYGVPDDGVEDATQAIADMLVQVPAGATIRAAPGQVFRVTEPLMLSRPVTLLGGTYLATPGGGTFIIDSDDVTLQGLTIQGSGVTPVNSQENFVTTTGTSARWIRRTRIIDCEMYDCKSSFLWLSWISDFWISGNTIERGQYAGIMLLSPKSGVVSQNVIRDFRQEGSLVNSYGIAATDVDNTVEARAENVLIEGNSVYDIPGWEGIDTHGGKDVRIIGNTIVGCPNPIAVTVGSSNRVTAPEGCVVSGNYMEKGNITGVELAGIVFNGSSPDKYAHGTIGHNVIRGFAKDLIMDWLYVAKTTVAPQSHDGVTRRSPAQTAFRDYAAVSSITVPSGALGGTSQVTFQAGYFTIPPVVNLTKGSSAGARFVPYVTSVTKDGCTIGVYNPSGITEGSAITIPVHIRATQTGSVVNGHTTI